MPATVKTFPTAYQRPADMESCFAALGISSQTDLISQLPFTGNDTSAGSETELQAIVIGNRNQVDLPSEIERSRFFSNLQRRTQSGDSPERRLTELREYLDDENNRAWENSWVRFARKRLSPTAEKVLNRDLLADKNAPGIGNRSDSDRFQIKPTAERTTCACRSVTWSNSPWPTTLATSVCTTEDCDRSANHCWKTTPATTPRLRPFPFMSKRCPPHAAWESNWREKQQNGSSLLSC